MKNTEEKDFLDRICDNTMVPAVIAAFFAGVVTMFLTIGGIDWYFGGMKAEAATTDLVQVEDAETFDGAPVAGRRYYVLDICRPTSGRYGDYCYFTSVMEDDAHNRIFVELARDSTTYAQIQPESNEAAEADLKRRHNHIIVAGDTVVYRGNGLFDVIKE